MVTWNKSATNPRLYVVKLGAITLGQVTRMKRGYAAIPQYEVRNPAPGTPSRRIFDFAVDAERYLLRNA